MGTRYSAVAAAARIAAESASALSPNLPANLTTLTPRRAYASKSSSTRGSCDAWSTTTTFSGPKTDAW